MLHPRVSTTAASAPKVCGHHSTLPFAQRTHSLCLALPQSLDQCNTSCVILRYQTFPAWGTQQNRLLCLQPAIAPERGERPSSLANRGNAARPARLGPAAPRGQRAPPPDRFAFTFAAHGGTEQLQKLNGSNLTPDFTNSRQTCGRPQLGRDSGASLPSQK